jgi:hypothetical protein
MSLRAKGKQMLRKRGLTVGVLDSRSPSYKGHCQVNSPGLGGLDTQLVRDQQRTKGLTDSPTPFALQLQGVTFGHAEENKKRSSSVTGRTAVGGESWRSHIIMLYALSDGAMAQHQPKTINTGQGHHKGG